LGLGNCNESAVGVPVPVLSFADFSTGRAALRDPSGGFCLQIASVLSALVRLKLKTGFVV